MCQMMKEDSRPRDEAQCLAVFRPVADPSTYRTRKSVRTTRATPAFHKNTQEMRHWLPFLIDAPERKYSYSVARVLVPARDAVFDIIPVLNQIELMANIRKSAEALDLGRAEVVIVMEEEWHARMES